MIWICEVSIIFSETLGEDKLPNFRGEVFFCWMQISWINFQCFSRCFYNPPAGSHGDGSQKGVPHPFKKKHLKNKSNKVGPNQSL